jgi:poly(A) polymerase
MERIWQEFKKMSQFAHFDKGLALLHAVGLLPHIFPSLKKLTTAEIEKRLSALPSFPKDAPAIAELLELFPEDSLEQLFDLCGYLKLSKQERDLVAFLHRARELFSMPSEWLYSLEQVEWAHFYAHPSSPLALNIRAAHVSDRAAFLREHNVRKQHLKTAIDRILAMNPVVNADALMRAGIAPGKNMGLLLKEAERIAVNQNIDDPDKIIEMLKNSAIWHPGP